MHQFMNSRMQSRIRINSVCSLRSWKSVCSIRSWKTRKKRGFLWRAARKSIIIILRIWLYIKYYKRAFHLLCSNFEYDPILSMLIILSHLSLLRNRHLVPPLLFTNSYKLFPVWRFCYQIDSPTRWHFVWRHLKSSGP